MIVRIRPGCFRLTSILAGTKEGWTRYNRFEEMPPALRTRCLKAIEGHNSGRVLIAGRSRPDGSEAAPARAASCGANTRDANAIQTMGLAAALFHLVTGVIVLAWYFRVIP
ncbi:MAG: hypothetical protein ACP5UT_00480 [Bryobacteraceae bacterium]